MSELITTTKHKNLRWQLLATVSALALTVHVTSVKAEDAARPTVWIELGSQFESVTGKNDPFLPPFDAAGQALGFPSAAAIQNVLGHAYGGEGSLTFQPEGSDWVFTASARYGRVSTAKHGHAEKAIIGPLVGQYLTPGGKHFRQAGIAVVYLVTPTVAAYVEQTAENSEAHAIVDFQVGKDIGIGLFGRGTETVVGFGARYAQFNARSDVLSYGVADGEFQIIPNPVFAGKYSTKKTHHNSASFAHRYSNFRALGPSISVNNSTTLLGNTEEGRLGIDWGMNAAVLFGRQRTKVHHQSTTRELGPGGGVNNVQQPYNIRSTQSTGAYSTRSRRVAVPNLGGFAAVSYRFTNAKLSAGYRADFFFGALDRGLDTRDTVTTGFHGPFATVSFGLGG